MSLAFKLKSKREIELMREAGRLVHTVLDRLAEIAVPGTTTRQLDAEAEAICHQNGAECLFKGVPGPGGPFPGNICCSINEQVVHGIPGPRVLRSGDVVSIDCGVRLDGYCGDAARTLRIGTISTERQRLLAVTAEALSIAIERMRPKCWWSEVAGAINRKRTPQLIFSLASDDP